MTPPPDPADLPGPWPGVLAAYVDGELDDHARACVERWLAVNPGAGSSVDAQRELSPENWRLWRDAAPPSPCPATWGHVLDGIASGIGGCHASTPAPARGAWRRRAAQAVVATACGLTLFVVSLAAFGPWFLPPLPQQLVESVALAPEDPLAGIAVLTVATESEVDVHRVDGAGAGGWLPVGGVPLSGPLALATADDLAVEEAEEHPAWPAGGPRVTRDPADAPVLFPESNR